MLKKNKRSDMPIIMLVNNIKSQGFDKQQSKKNINDIVLGNIVGCTVIKWMFKRSGKLFFM